MITNLFADYRCLAYRLYAVFMHHGSVEFGHYYIYIYDFKKEIWRKYNDNDVREVQDPAEIFAVRQEENPPTPYFLVYVHDSMKDRLVDPVCREIFDPFPSGPSSPPPQQQQEQPRPRSNPEDTTMEDARMTTPTEKPADPPAYDQVLAEGVGSPGMGANPNLPEKPSITTTASTTATAITTETTAATPATDGQ